MDNHRRRRRIQQFAILYTCAILTATTAILASYSKEPEPYHTSILTGEAWVLELLSGHPDRIRCELGVSHDVFDKLICELRKMGHKNSKYVSLEEQLAIFLYCSVTGLTIRHVGERFQRSNETISRYATFLFILQWSISYCWQLFSDHAFHFLHTTFLYNICAPADCKRSHFR